MTILARRRAPNTHSDPAQPAGSNTYKAVTEAVGSLRKYQDVPVHLQKQWITTFLTTVVLVGIVASLYLNVASRAAIDGREIQSLRRSIIANQRINADLQTHIATLLSNEALEERALEAGFMPLQADNLDYMVVPGYFPPQGVTLVSLSAEVPDIRLSPEYSESLLDWLARQIEAASRPLAQEH